MLQRARYAKLQEQINNEKTIQSLNNATVQVKSELKTIQAKRVIFGTASRDFQGNIILRLSFENLSTSQIKISSAFISGEEYYNFDKRKQKLVAFINSFLNINKKIDPPPPSSGCSPDNMPYSMESEGGKIKIELCQCYYYQNKIICPLRIKNQTNSIEDVTIYSNGGGSRLIIDDGKDYLPTGGLIMSKTSGNSCCVSAEIPATKNGVKGQITFDKVTTKSKAIEALEIRTRNGTGSFTDVPLIHAAPPTN